MNQAQLQQIDLIHLVEQNLNRHGKSAGRKWMRFQCPFCKTFPESLYVTNGDEGRGNWFYCKICDRRGDVLQWVVSFQRKTTMEAMMYLQIGRNPQVRIAERHKPTAAIESESR